MYNIPFNESKRSFRMEYLTLKVALFFSIYCPLYLLGLLTITPNDVRFWILTAFLIITGTIRFVRWLRRDDQNYEQKQIEITQERLEATERELEQQEKRIQILEREKQVLTKSK